MTIKHNSAKASHYDYAADKYDAIYDRHPEIDNVLIASLLSKHKVNTVLDLSCGTGAQTIYLAQAGFSVFGFDINKKMLRHAKIKARKFKVPCELCAGDMRTTHVGSMDAALTIFNSIGHLTKADFKKTLRNIYKNLKPGGVYFFDIFNLNYMLDKDNITNLTVDQVGYEKNKIIRKIQYSTIDKKGVLASHTTSIIGSRGIETKGVQTLQIYSADELKVMLEKAGFKLIRKMGIDGSKFNDKKTKHMLIVAKKIH